MPKFEIFIPPAKTGANSVTVRIAADSWMAALKTGLHKLGEHGDPPANLMVDVMEDQSMHVTDSSTGRVFRIMELPETGPGPAKSPPAPPAKPMPSTASSAPAGHIGRTHTTAPVEVEDVLSELFERTQDVFGKERDQGLYFLLDLALEKIPAEAGSVFVCDMGRNDLELVSVRGPKTEELKRMKLRMPMGLGIVGFCAQEVVSLAISDTEKDARFYRNVSAKIGYQTRSILCAPMVADGRIFGCLEIINKKNNSSFTDSELAILAYIAHQGAKYLESI